MTDNDLTFREGLTGFSTNQLRYELMLRENEISDTWRNSPETKCYHCTKVYVNCTCDYEDMSIHPPKPNTSPCSGDHFWLVVGTSEHKATWVKNKYKGVDVYSESCWYCLIVRNQWLRVKDPNKPHYYAADMRGEQTIRDFEVIFNLEMEYD